MATLVDRRRRSRTHAMVTGSAEAGSLTPARWSMLDLGVAQAGFTRRPTQAFEVSVDVQEGQFASECRMHDQFL